jgi:hypothetical protein
MSRTACAEEMAEAAREAGHAAAELNAAAWSAGVVPEATHGITGAAVALGAPVSSLFARVRPLHDDKAMLESASDLEGSCAEMLRDSRSFRQSSAAEHVAACDAIAAMDTGVPPAVIIAAQRRIADCEAAIELLDDLIRRLEYALACLYRVPDDLEATYEVPYAHVRAGGVLPRAGDFLTGSPVLEGTPH